jgi:hypothetical protein
VTIHEFLAADHRRLDALLANASVDPVAYTEFRRGLLRHIAMEEKVLFPIARAQHRDVVARLHADHAAIASLLVPPPTPALMGTLEGVLAEHNPIEDAPGGLYEICDQIGGDDVIARMQAIPPVRASQHVDEPRIYEHIERMLAARLKSG